MGRSNIDIRYICKGASKQVTGSMNLLKINVENKEYQIVVDYGIIQNGLKNMNELYNVNKSERHINWEEVSAMVLTHSHA